MRKMSKKFIVCLVAFSLIAAVLPVAALADGTYGTVALETKLDTDIVVYENRFANEAAFNAVYNQDVDYGIHPINASAGSAVKFSYQSNFTGAGLAAANYESTQIRTYNGDSQKKAKGFWIDLDKVLADYGPGTYSFSFRVNSPAKPGLIEAVLNTAEDQSVLGDILWTSHDQTESSPYVNLGGHVLCRRWTEDGTGGSNNNNGNNNQDALNNVTLSSTTYVPESASHLRFFFGGTIFDGTANNYNVGGKSNGWTPVFFDDLVITKKANMYQDAAVMGGTATLTSRLTSLDGNDHDGVLISAVYDSSNGLYDFQTADVTVSGSQEETSTVNVPASGDYTIKTFFWDDLDNITPYTLSSKQYESLASDGGFETPFTYLDQRWMKSTSENADLVADAAYTGLKGVKTTKSSSDTWTYIGYGAKIPTAGTQASPGDPSLLADVLNAYGKGQYKISFMAKTAEAGATANAYLMYQPIYQDYGKLASSIGYINTTSCRYSTSAQAVTDEWTKVEYTVNFYPLPSGKTVGAGNTSGWLSYRYNNYAFWVVATGASESTSLYIDDFKIEKISDL